MKKTFYHGTSPERWETTQKQGHLLHERATKEWPNMSPVTYLAVDKEEAEQYGEVVLEVKYDPSINEKENNYMEGAWQMRVYEKIDLSDVKRVDQN